MNINLDHQSKRWISWQNKSWKKLGIKNTDGSLFMRYDYDRLYQVQSGCCAICKRHQTELTKSLAADHDHTNGTIRGLLCTRCNTLLGMKEDSKWNCLASQYLNNFQSNFPVNTDKK